MNPIKEEHLREIINTTPEFEFLKIKNYQKENFDYFIEKLILKSQGIVYVVQKCLNSIENITEFNKEWIDHFLNIKMTKIFIDDSEGRIICPFAYQMNDSQNCKLFLVFATFARSNTPISSSLLIPKKYLDDEEFKILKAIDIQLLASSFGFYVEKKDDFIFLKQRENFEKL